MNGCLFIICWILAGLLNVPILILLRKKFNRERTQCWLDEIQTCIRYGPLLLMGIFLAGLTMTEEEKREKKNKELRMKILDEAERLRIKSRFEILDIR